MSSKKNKMKAIMIFINIFIWIIFVLNSCNSSNRTIECERDSLALKIEKQLLYGIEEYLANKVFIISLDSITNFDWDYVFIDNLETRLEVGNKQFYYKDAKYLWNVSKKQVKYATNRFIFVKDNSVIQYVDIHQDFIKRIHFRKDTGFLYNSFTKKQAKFIVCCKNINADIDNCSVVLHPISGCSYPNCFCQDFYLKNKK